MFKHNAIVIQYKHLGFRNVFPFAQGDEINKDMICYRDDLRYGNVVWLIFLISVTSCKTSLRFNGKNSGNLAEY